MEFVLVGSRHRVIATMMLLGIAVAFTAVLSAAPRAGADDRYYKESDQPGFWWGKDPLEEKPEEEPHKMESPKEEKKAERRVPKLSDYTMQQLWEMHPDEFQALTDEFKKKAVQYPTEGNVKDFYTLVDVGRRKAVAFMDVQQLVLQKSPELSMARDNSYLAPAMTANRKLEQEVRNRVEAARDDYALIYFYQDGCPYCEEQSGILKYLVDSRHWNVKPVNIVKQPDLAARFNVTVTPTILLIKRGSDDYLPLGTGLMTLDQLEGGIYNGMRLIEGEIKPEQYGMREYQKGGTLDPLAPLQSAPLR